MNSLFIGFIAMLACICFYLIKGGEKKYVAVSWTVYALLFGIVFYLFMGKVIYRFTHPEIWDFTCFYLYGKVAAGGYDFYLAENFQHVFANLTLPFTEYGEFITEVVNVGFPYPPPTMLYFAPLSFLSYNTAIVVWGIFNLLFLFASIYLTYNLFFKSQKFNGLALVVILFLVSTEVRSTVFYSQTNFILIFLLLMMKKYANSKYVGILLAIALFTKPYMAAFVLLFILTKNWKTIPYFLATVFALVGITAALFGTAPFYSYIFNNPAHRLPPSVFFEWMNQSLHSVLLRANIITLKSPGIYMGIAAILLIAAIAYLIYLKKKQLYDYIWVVILLVALTLYPGTLTYYGVLLLFIIFQFFDEQKQLGFNVYLSIPIVTASFILSTYSLFAGIVFLLTVIVLKSLGFFNTFKLFQRQT